ncbi:MAG: NAD(P)H-hydrate epimerase, partial [Myxococcaceae bacterium]
MKRLVTAVQMRAIEAASAEAGVPPSELMETAGRHLADAAMRLCAPTGQIIVICGPGNNGGDGLVAARFLANARRTVHVELVGDPASVKEDPARNLKALKAAGVQPRPLADNHSVGTGDVVVDCVFGTGLTRAPEGPFADAIRRMNVWRAGGAKVIAADLPSGVHTDTGQAFSPAVRADLTISLGHFKAGHAVEPGASLAGELELVDIGIPASCAQAAPGGSAWLLEEEDVRARIPERKRDTHKGTYGHVLVIAGSWGKTGAAALTS